MLREILAQREGFSGVGQQELPCHEALGDLPTVAKATCRLSWSAIAPGDRARSYALPERSRELYQQLDNGDQHTLVVLVLGELACAEGDLYALALLLLVVRLLG